MGVSVSQFIISPIFVETQNIIYCQFLLKLKLTGLSVGEASDLEWFSLFASVLLVICTLEVESQEGYWGCGSALAPEHSPLSQPDPDTSWNY